MVKNPYTLGLKVMKILQYIKTLWGRTDIYRHSKHEDWHNPLTAAVYATNILWNKPTITESIRDTHRRLKNINIIYKSYSSSLSWFTNPTSCSAKNSWGKCLKTAIHLEPHFLKYLICSGSKSTCVCNIYFTLFVAAAGKYTTIWLSFKIILVHWKLVGKSFVTVHEIRWWRPTVSYTHLTLPTKA